MSNTVVGILGIVTIVAIVVTLFKSKTQPAIAFIVFPAILGLVLVLGGRFSFDDLAAMIKAGFNSTAPTAALFVFSVLYFGIMSDAGMFDVIIGKLIPAGSGLMAYRDFQEGITPALKADPEAVAKQMN